jgi:hypothetical protein
MDEGRGGCSPQTVMLDFMTVIVGVTQVVVTIAVAIKSDKNDNNNNDNNNNNNNNNNNLNINDDNINFMMMGEQNMMAMGRGKRFSMIPVAIQPCLTHFFCSLRKRRYEMNDFEEIGLKTIK